MVAPKPPGISNTKAGKVAILERTKEVLKDTSFLMAVPIQGVSKENVDFLKRDLPKGTKASVVKNTLLRLAVKGTSFENVGDEVCGENMFFFIQEGGQKQALEAYNKWRKGDAKRAEPEFDIKFGIMENQLYKNAALEEVVKLPTKKELIAQIASRIKAVPTKLARTVKAVPTKVARAINAVKEKKEKESA